MWNVESRHGPVIEVFEVEGTRERRLVIGYKMGGTSKFFRFVLIQIAAFLRLTCISPVLCPISTTFTLCTPPANMLVRIWPSLSPCSEPHIPTEQFSNGITIISLYLNPLPDANAPPIEHSIFQVMKEVSLLFCLPDNPYFLPGAHAVQEATYACQYLSPRVSFVITVVS